MSRGDARKTTVVMTVRHGDTDFNHQRRYAGRIDVPLNDKGLQDAVAAAPGIELPVDVVISSTLKRAVQTAQALVGDTREIVQSELCSERHFGTMQGLTPDEVEGLRPYITYIKVGGDFHSLNPPLGETFPALRRRVKEFAEYLWTEYAGSTVLVVSHEVFLLQYHGLLRGETWQEALKHRLPNLTLTTFAMRGSRVESEISKSLVAREQEDGSFFVLLPADKG